MKVNEVINTMVEAMAEKIDRLKSDLFCKDYEIEQLKSENEKLKKAVEYFEQALRGEEGDGKL